MTTLTRKCHIKALSENLELGLLAGFLASGIDSFWVVMDMIQNGPHFHYFIILPVLLISTIILFIALIRHHRANFKLELGLLYKYKKEVVRRKNKRNK